MRPENIHVIVATLKREVKKWRAPVVGVVAEQSSDPFLVLISTLLSLRTKDAVTDQASQRLFAKARTPQAMLQIPPREIEKLIYPVCFYRNKTQTIRHVCREILDRFCGRVPDDMDGLLSMKGVGRKTANLVLTLGFGKPGICVDVHVHRISNRLGYIRTKSPDESEMVLRKKLPKKYWLIYNDLLVPYGQNLCTPVSPWCSRCLIRPLCSRVGVRTSR